MICAAVLAGAVAPGRSALLDPSRARLGGTFELLRSRLTDSEAANNVKCWVTFRRTENMLAGLPLNGDAAHLRAKTLQSFVRQVWSYAQYAEPKSSKDISAASVEMAAALFFNLSVAPLPDGGQRVYLHDQELSPLEFLATDIRDQAATSEAWRAIIAVAQNSDSLYRDLNPAALDTLADRALQFNMSLLRVAAAKARKASEAYITQDSIREASKTFYRMPYFTNLSSKGPNSKHAALVLSAWYAEAKIQSLRKVNQAADRDIHRRTQSDIAEFPLDEAAADYLQNAVLPMLARDVWKRAQKRLPADVLLVSGERMHEAIAELFPYETDEEENVVFFPGQPGAVRLLAHWGDAYRDDARHWQILLDLYKEVDMDLSAADALHAPLDAYAAEELTEVLSDLPVLILRNAAARARASGHPSIGRATVREAYDGIMALSRSSAGKSSVASPIGDLVPAAEKKHSAILQAQPFFADVSTASGLPQKFESPKENSWIDDTLIKKRIRGVAIEDYDRDGLPDVFVSGPYGGLFRNKGGMAFEDVTKKARLSGRLTPFAIMASFADVDNDGWPDLLIASGDSPTTLMRNQGDGTFADISEKSGLGRIPYAKGAVWLDYDLDGLLDLYIYRFGDVNAGVIPTLGDAVNGLPNSLFKNMGNGVFRDVTKEAGVGDTRWAHAAAVVDYDDDRFPDIYISNDFGQDVLYRNLGNGCFRDVAVEAGVADMGHGMGVSIGDFDRDGRPDIYSTNIGMYNPRARYIRPTSKTEMLTNVHMDRFVRLIEANGLFRNDGGGTFTNVHPKTVGPVKTGWGWNGYFFDFDNDGWLDIHVANGAFATSLYYHDERKVLMRFDSASRRYEDVSRASGADFPGNSRGGGFADFDRDGRLDVLVVGLHPARLFRNQVSGGNHYLDLKLEGTKSNRDAIGAKVQLRVGQDILTDWVGGQGGGLASQCLKELHFGLGSKDLVDEVTIRWPSGTVTTLETIKADQRVVVREPG